MISLIIVRFSGRNGWTFLRVAQYFWEPLLQAKTDANDHYKHKAFYTLNIQWYNDFNIDTRILGNVPCVKHPHSDEDIDDVISRFYTVENGKRVLVPRR